MKQIYKIIVLSLLIVKTITPLSWIGNLFDQPTTKIIKDKDEIHEFIELFKNQNYINFILYFSKTNYKINQKISNEPIIKYITNNHEKATWAMSKESFLHKLEKILPILLKKNKELNFYKITHFIKKHLVFFYCLTTLNKIINLKKEILIYKNEYSIENLEIKSRNRKIYLKIKQAQINEKISSFPIEYFLIDSDRNSELDKKSLNKHSITKIENLIKKEHNNFQQYILCRYLRLRIENELYKISIEKTEIENTIKLNQKKISTLEKELKIFFNSDINELLSSFIKPEEIDLILYSNAISSFNENTIEKMTELVPKKNILIRYEYEKAIFQEPYDNDLLYIDYYEKCCNIIIQFLKIIKKVINYKDLSESSQDKRKNITEGYRRTKSERNLYYRKY